MTRYDLIPPNGLRAAAEAMSDGLAKYGEGDWLRHRANPLFATDKYNHAMAHMLSYKNSAPSTARKRSEVAHAIADLMLVYEHLCTRLSG